MLQLQPPPLSPSPPAPPVVVDPAAYGAIAFFNLSSSSTSSPPPPEETATDTITGRIAGGTPAPQGAYPYAASIIIYGTHACGGALIEPRVVLTAGHCVYDKQSGNFFQISAISVSLGSVNLNEGTNHKIRGMVMPNTFIPSRNFYGDVALILLDGPQSGTTSKLIIHPKKNAKTYKAIGWGKTPSGYLSPTLQQVTLRGMSRAMCAAKHRQYGMGELPADHICSGLNSSGADTCEGDSGGPLLSGAYQVGVTSYGPPNAVCGDKQNFGLYTSVAYWHTWIEDSLSVYNMRGSKRPWKFNKPQFNTCYVSGTYKTYATPTMGACCEKCRASKGCAAWSWSKSSKACVFKHKGAFKVQPSKNCHSGRFY